ncbi:MAG: ECF transporter S component [Bacillota bacterium]
MEVKNSGLSGNRLQVKEMVQIALLTALTYIAVSFINIPYGNGGVIHLGDSMIFLSAVLFGRKHSAISGAVGMAMFDLFSPYTVWAPYTFVIKGVMGLIAGSIAFSGESKGTSWLKNGLGMVLAGLWMVAGYYAAEVMIYGNALAPMASLPGNLIQFGGGAVIAYVLAVALKNTKYFN